MCLKGNPSECALKSYHHREKKNRRDASLSLDREKSKFRILAVAVFCSTGTESKGSSKEAKKCDTGEKIRSVDANFQYYP